MIRLLISLFVLLSPVTFCSELKAQQRIRTGDESSHVAVVSAFSRELTPLLNAAAIQRTEVINGRAYYIGRLAGSDVVMVLAGIGLTTSSSTSQTLIDSFNVSAILFSGIAGGINPDLNIGDVTIPVRWRQADIPAGADEGWFDVDLGMMAAARTVLDSVELDSCTAGDVCLEYDPEIFADGNGVSNSSFVDDAEYRDWLWDTFQADVVDMETSAVAEVARDNHIPFLAIRCISDLAGGSGSNQVNTYLDLAADNAAAVTIEVLGAWSATLGSVDEPAPSSEGYAITGSYPNPFNSTTTIEFELPHPTHAFLTVYDALGIEVARLLDGASDEGYHQIEWGGNAADGRSVASGIYIARLVTPEYTNSIKMLLLK
ncbi:5'-methylthioadenosine/S-adenosylhomocysteine nucleosidase [Candidatus Neomarinimicrobiota bacterium]